MLSVYARSSSRITRWAGCSKPEGLGAATSRRRKSTRASSMFSILSKKMHRVPARGTPTMKNGRERHRIIVGVPLAGTLCRWRPRCYQADRMVYDRASRVPCVYSSCCLLAHELLEYFLNTRMHAVEP